MAESKSRWPRIVGHSKAQPPPEVPAAFSAPDYDRVLGVDNPFPAGNGLHTQWERRRLAAASDAAELFARLQAELRTRVEAEPKQRWTAARDVALEWWSSLFDIRARAGLPLKAYAQFNPRRADRFAAWLTSHANAILAHVIEETEKTGILRDELGPALTSRLAERRAHWMAVAYVTDQRALARSKRAARSPRLNTKRATAAQIRWRRERVKKYRSDNELDTLKDLARHVAMSESAIAAIIREDRKSRKCTDSSRDRFLKKLGITLADWYPRRR